MRYIVWFFWILLFAVLVLFAVYNLDPTPIHLLGQHLSYELPLFVLLAISFLLGLSVAALGNLRAYLKGRRQCAQLKNECKKLEKEVARLREADAVHRMAQSQVNNQVHSQPSSVQSPAPATAAPASPAGASPKP